MISGHDKTFTYTKPPEDDRDLIYERSSTDIKPFINLTEYASAVDDQYLLGSCVSTSIVNAYELLVIKEKVEPFTNLSRLFLYYNIRKIYGNIDENTGASIRDGIKTVKQYGLCDESCWPYDVEKFAVQPPEICYTAALHRSIKKYYALTNIGDCLDALSLGFPLVIGLQIYNNFLTIDSTNNILTNPTYPSTPLGGHAMCIIGYDLQKNLFLAKNSFGTNWGDKGYCWITFDYIQINAFDIWMFEILIT